MNPDNERKLSFTLAVPTSRVDELFDTLRQAGFEADPQKTLTCSNATSANYTTAVGADAQNLIKRINEHLKEHDCEPLIPEKNQDWPLDRLNQLLKLAMTNFDWEDDKVQNVWWTGLEEEWSNIIEEYALVFTDRQEN